MGLRAGAELSRRAAASPRRRPSPRPPPPPLLMQVEFAWRMGAFTAAMWGEMLTPLQVGGGGGAGTGARGRLGVCARAWGPERTRGGTGPLPPTHLTPTPPARACCHPRWQAASMAVASYPLLPSLLAVEQGLRAVIAEREAGAADGAEAQPAAQQ
jgi:hypothetical protein